MSALTALARVHAAESGQAQRTTTVRHVHVGAQPLVCVPLALAGEANAPLAVMIGTDRARPLVRFVVQPRNRDQRFEFANVLAQIMLGYIGGFPAVTVPPAQGRRPVHHASTIEAPQVWVPNRVGIEFLKLFGRSTRFRSPEGPYPVPPSVPRLGRWLTFLAERAEIPGSSMLVASTEVLTGHWATGQSAVEDAHLAALMGWIDPPTGSSGAEAARAAEDPVLHPPAGPSTDPTFDREVLAPSIATYDTASDPTARQRAVTRLEAALRTQLEPTWQLVWWSIELMRQLPAGGHVAHRWQQDVEACARHYAHVAAHGPPQPKRDNAVRAAIRLNTLERLQASYDAQRAFDDPLVMAEHRLAGEAFDGTVTSVDPDRRIGRALRPRITIRTEDRVRLGPRDGTVSDRARPGQRAEIVSIVEAPGGLEIALELAGGMGNGRAPCEGTVPAAGDRVCYSTLTDRYQRRGEFPAAEDTPWTHGGPPVHAMPTHDDAREEWA